ncbi:methyltransferase [Reticulibacter mediterranei]|uniref:Methyltransferase n=1 Tax=Reticulibacter mediterranei TaxID=2778369 RepID=A0A8J3IRT8_9CHLR|nr:methyltransferase domain-containing protein [Reticulibacter mediterranei]GHO95086.1 methyltransferase [Reticulibacter mediterranei]
MTQTSPQDSDEKKARVQDYFSRTAENYVTSTTHRTGSDLQRLVDLGEWDAQQQALDIATGGGHTALAVAPHVAHIVVSDLTPRMLEKARAFLLSQNVTNAEFVPADAENLPFASASFDRVTCRIAPHHFPNVARFVQEVARVLKPGGIFLLIDNIAPDASALDTFINTVEKRRDSSHGRCCTLIEWRRFFADAGLSVELEEVFRRTHNYDDWTARSQLAASEKAKLERFILTASEEAQRYFAVTADDGHLKQFNTDVALLKGRKQQ